MTEKLVAEPWQAGQSCWIRLHAPHVAIVRAIASVYWENGAWSFAAARAHEREKVDRGSARTPEEARRKADKALERSGWELLSQPEDQHKATGRLQELVSELPGSPQEGSMVDIQDTIRRLVERVKQMTPREVLEISIRAGIHNADGTLTAKYGGDDKSQVTMRDPDEFYDLPEITAENSAEALRKINAFQRAYVLGEAPIDELVIAMHKGMPFSGKEDPVAWVPGEMPETWVRKGCNGHAFAFVERRGPEQFIGCIAGKPGDFVLQCSSEKECKYFIDEKLSFFAHEKTGVVPWK